MIEAEDFGLQWWSVYYQPIPTGLMSTARIWPMLTASEQLFYFPEGDRTSSHCGVDLTTVSPMPAETFLYRPAESLARRLPDSSSEVLCYQ